MPARALVQRSRPEPVPAKNCGNARLRNWHAELLQFAHDAQVAPPLVLPRPTADELDRRGIGAATAGVLGASGARLVAHYRGDRDGAEAATAAIAAERKLLLQADLSEPGSGRDLW